MIQFAGDEMPTEEKITNQTNIGSEQRNAARDYLEFHNQTSVAFVLSTWSAQKLDRTAIENSRFFEERYGFQAPKPARIKFIEYQRKHELLDIEASSLKKTGFIQITRQDIRVDTSLLMPALGWFQMLLLIGMVALMLQVILTSQVPDLEKIFGTGLLSSIFLATAAWIIKTCIRPRQLLNECGALRPTNIAASNSDASPRR